MICKEKKPCENCTKRPTDKKEAKNLSSDHQHFVLRFDSIFK